MKKILYLLIVFTFLISGLWAGNFTFKIKNGAGFPGRSFRFSNLLFSYYSSNNPKVRMKSINNLGVGHKWLEKYQGERNITLDDVDASEEVNIMCTLVNVQTAESSNLWYPGPNGIIKPLWGKGKGFKKISNDAVLQLEHVPSYSDFEHKEFRVKIGNWLSR